MLHYYFRRVQCSHSPWSTVKEHKRLLPLSVWVALRWLFVWLCEHFSWYSALLHELFHAWFQHLKYLDRGCHYKCDRMHVHAKLLPSGPIEYYLLCVPVQCTLIITCTCTYVLHLYMSVRYVHVIRKTCPVCACIFIVGVDCWVSDTLLFNMLLHVVFVLTWSYR